jgi:hypothetical protein
MENTSNNSLPMHYGEEKKLQRATPFTDEWYRKIKQHARRGAQYRGKEFTLTSLDIKNCFIRCKAACFYCGMSNGLSEEVFGMRLTIDRVDARIGYIPENIVCSCVHCNQIKDNYLSVDEMKIIGKIMKHAIIRKIKCDGSFKDRKEAEKYWRKYNGK